MHKAKPNNFGRALPDTARKAKPHTLSHTSRTPSDAAAAAVAAHTARPHSMAQPGGPRRVLPAATLHSVRPIFLRQALLACLLAAMLIVTVPYFAQADESEPGNLVTPVSPSADMVEWATLEGDAPESAQPGPDAPAQEAEGTQSAAETPGIDPAAEGLAGIDEANNAPQSLVGIAPLDIGIMPLAGDPNDAPQYGQISLVKFVDISNGQMGGMALDSSGHVWVWGYNLYGELAAEGTVPDTGYYGGMKRVPYFARNGIFIKEIGSSYETRYALGSDGRVYAWGHGANGAMGNDSSTPANRTPAPVPGLENVEHIFVSTSYLGQASVFALTKTGELYGWGNNGGGLLGIGNSTTQTRPVLIPLPAELAERNIVKISAGRTCAFILDDQGDLWGSGADNDGQQGNGPGGAQTTFTKMDRSLSGMGPVVDVSVGYSLAATSDRVCACDVNGDAWEWGRTYGDAGGADAVRVKQTPTKIILDPDEVANWGYTPLAQKVEASERVCYFIDQHGRPWGWGTGYYFGFGTDGPYIGATGNTQVIPSTAAKQVPAYIGDGDTQVSATFAYNKYPKYLEGYEAPDGVLVTSENSFHPSQAGQRDVMGYYSYGFNPSHPTIYDEKYMLKNENGIVMDEDGNYLRMATATTMNGVSGLTIGYYYYSDGNGTQNGTGANNNILSPATRGIPAIDPDDWVWIRLAFMPTPYISVFDCSLSAYAFLDADGNIFKWGNDGSGSVAWGWDYEPMYDSYSQPRGATDGLYDRYTYEVMYMRGAPTIDRIALTGGDTKKVYTEPGESVEHPLEVTVHMPRSTYNDALESHVYSDLSQLLWIVIPYDEDDPNFYRDIDTFSVEEFMELYDAMDDVYKGELLSEPLQSGSTKREETIIIDVPRNGRLIVYGDNERYVSADGGITHDYVNRDALFYDTIIDTVYTPANVAHRGEGVDPNGVVTEIYVRTDDSVSKTNDDRLDLYDYDRDKDFYGLPLDANGEVIEDPTFGYDSVEILSYELFGYPAVAPGDEDPFIFWKWMEYIPEEWLSRALIEQPKSKDLYLDDGEYAGYTHTFYYEPRRWTEAPSGVKIWDDDSNKFNTRPNEITLVLQQFHRDPETGEMGDFIKEITSITIPPTVLDDDTWGFEFPGYLKSYIYTYRLLELDIPVPPYTSKTEYPKLVISGDIEVEDFSGIEVTNTLDLRPVLFYKVDADDPDHPVITHDYAEFTLTNAETGGKVYDEAGVEWDSVVLSSDDDGRVVMPKQGPGTYHLTETKAPAGFNLLTMPVVVVIDPDGSITATLGDLPLMDVPLDGDDEDTYAAAFNITNKPAAELPMAGGTGVLLLLSISAAIAFMAAFNGFMRRKGKTG
ncbi:MAG: SpaA isopeptide-forming pilin-related protein [Eggerthellaceae bacterium]|nr:SpaA isopeptide-forming pilin-related protein [Eggerthellaceae bacterium]